MNNFQFNTALVLMHYSFHTSISIYCSILVHFTRNYYCYKNKFNLEKKEKETRNHSLCFLWLLVLVKPLSNYKIMFFFMLKSFKIETNSIRLFNSLLLNLYNLSIKNVTIDNLNLFNIFPFFSPFPKLMFFKLFC